MTKNDIAWDKLFSKYNILYEINKNGSFIISANQIKEFREPRLMTKFDHKINLPTIFSENCLSILPISRGEYIISTFLAYKIFDELSENTQTISIPNHLQSLMPEFIISESIALNCANACGILNDFTDEENIIPTVSGRMSSGNFSFKIDSCSGLQNIYVNNSQIEIDAAYEGIGSLSLFEAKMDLSDDFLIRQIYYPFRTWLDRVTKPINTILLIFSNGTFNLYNYRFNNVNCYNSIELIDQKNYIISTNITVQDIENIMLNTEIVNEPDIPFPQADRMERVINLIELLNERPMSKQEITLKYEFDERQTNYYTDAGRYLNIIDRYYDCSGTPYFKLTEVGNTIMKLRYRERQLAIIKQIIMHTVFNKVLTLHLRNGEMPDKNTIMNIMKESCLFNIGSESTYYRRTSTVSSWIYWILGRIDLTS